MTELDTLISVIGTLGGTIVGLVLGYWTTSRIEKRRQQHETEMEYRKQLIKQSGNVTTPLYHFVQELWGSLAVLSESVRMKSSNANELLLETQKAEQDLKKFCNANYTNIDLLLPHPLSTWVFAPIEERIDKILVQISEGKEPAREEFVLVINALMKYQKNLKTLLGYETEKKLEDVYPFT